MDTQNVTLAIPKTVLKQAKIIAIEKDTSLSRLLTTYIETIVSQDSAYKQAKQEALVLMEEGFDMGTYGNANWTRDDLHDR